MDKKKIFMKIMTWIIVGGLLVALLVPTIYQITMMIKG